MKTPVHLPGPSTRWRLTAFTRGSDFLIVARALQKATVPEIDVEAVAYTRQHARLEFVLLCSAARAELTRQKLERLVDVRHATVQPFDHATDEA